MQGPIFKKISYDEFTITNMPILERSYDDFMILSYD